MTDVILVVNSGSSSLKFAIYPAATKVAEPLLRGKVSGIGRDPQLVVTENGHAVALTEPLSDIPDDATHEWLITRLLERLQSRYVEMNPVAAGHRVVHGGRDFEKPVLVDGHVRVALGELTSLAPLHQPHNLAAIDAIGRDAPGLPQVACFDTSFHRAQPRLAQLFALPRRLTDEGIVRYGFHGLSYDYIARCLPACVGSRAGGKVVVAHLGNGASMCAMRNQKSVASSMGFTALDGLVMGRRCGSLDPGVVLYLQEHQNMSTGDIQHMLYRESGLLGVSGISNNMQVLEASAEPSAREAIDLYCYRAAREVASLAGALGGLDVLVFTAGIGENSAEVRQQICDRSAWLGVELDHVANDANCVRISAETSAVDVCVIPTDEEAVIAAATRALI